MRQAARGSVAVHVEGRFVYDVASELENIRAPKNLRGYIIQAVITFRAMCWQYVMDLQEVHVICRAVKQGDQAAG